MFKTATILDTSIATLNIGDEIIMDAVRKQSVDAMPNHRFFTIPTHEYITKVGLSILKQSDYGIVGGSNILSSYMNEYKQWKLTLPHAYFMKKKMITMGVGWREYQKTPNWWTKTVLKQVLSKEFFHSVRDKYTEQKLNEIGFENVINTSCPTMWGLTPKHCEKIPNTKTKKVIFTISDYSKNKEADELLIQILLDNYKEVYFWVQSIRDFEYFETFSTHLKSTIKIVPPNLISYTRFLQNNDTDYVGTRLHGGIRALQNLKRTIIIGIDNRAVEKEKDFNLVVVKRQDQESDLDNRINSKFNTNIVLPMDNIKKWKMQFDS